MTDCTSRPRPLLAARLMLAWAVGLHLGCAGCSDTATRTARPNLSAAVAALSFESCPPAPGSPTRPFQDKKLTLSNVGQAAATVQSQFSAGAGVFSVVNTSLVVEPNSEAELVVRFSPTAAGPVTGELIIDDGDDETPSLKITLSGLGLQLPPEPKLVLKYQRSPGEPLRTFDDNVSNIIEYPETASGALSTIDLQIQNAGCPALAVSGIELTGDTGFEFIEPKNTPNTSQPLLIDRTRGDGTVPLKLAFRAPATTGTEARKAQLLLRSNDANRPLLTMQLFGTSTAPVLASNITSCRFSDATDPCGSGVKESGLARVTLENLSFVSALVLNKFAFRNPSARIQASTNAVGQSIAPRGKLEFTVSYQPGAEFVFDQLDIQAGLGTSQDGSAGQLSLQFSGGEKPCLSVDPLRAIDFGSTTSSKSVKLSNGAGCGELSIQRVRIDGESLFSITGAPVTGTKIAAGQSIQFQTTYTAPSAGGGYANADLVVETNDSDFSAPGYRRLQLSANTPVNARPSAVLQACLDANCLSRQEFSVRIAKSKFGNVLNVTGVDSFDPPGSTNAGLRYTMRLLSKPVTASTASLQNDGAQSNSPSTALTFGEDAVGDYLIGLVVTDSTGLQSAEATLRVRIDP